MDKKLIFDIVMLTNFPNWLTI